MRLSPRLELRQSQALVMTPQLMQAIKLLQLSNLDVLDYVEAELEHNPLLERAEAGAAPSDAPDGVDGFEAAGRHGVDDGPGDLTAAARDGDVGAIAASLDADFGNVYESDGAPVGPAPGPQPADSGWSSVRGDRQLGDGEGDFLDNAVAGQVTLHEHLLSQLTLAVSDPAARLIGGHLIDMIDEAGYLGENVPAIAERLGTSDGEVETVLSIIQGFDPAGVAARSLAECLAIQLRERNRFDPAMEALLGHLDLLARRDMAALKQLCGVDDSDLAEMAAEIRRLDPKPGHAFGASPVQPVVPDVFVRPRPDGSWEIELNSETLPRVLVDQTYYAAVARSTRSESDRSYLADCLQKASWLVRSLDQRARTILKVTSEIVRQQDSFLTRGVRHLRPLTLRMVAEAIDMHESTVSRVTANKYVATPRGTFELKYFFTTAIAATEGGEAHSAEAVRHRIRELIAAESPDDILSDDALVKMLREDGVEVARRTVAKYRESLKIGSSVQRRREKRLAV